MCPNYINYRLKSEVSITLHCQLCSTRYTAIMNQELFEKHLCNLHVPTKRNGAVRPSYINYCLKSEVSIALRCWIYSTSYTAVRIKNCSKSTSAIKVAIMKNMDVFRF